jgi:hypothetical protein
MYIFCQASYICHICNRIIAGFACCVFFCERIESDSNLVGWKLHNLMGLKLSSRSWQGWSSAPEADRIEAPQSDGVKAHQKLMVLKLHTLMVLKLRSTSWLILLKFHNLKVWSSAPQADHGVEAPQVAPNSDQVAKKRIYISFLERFALLIASLGCVHSVIPKVLELLFF